MNNGITSRMIEKVEGWCYEDIRQKVTDEYESGKIIADKKRPLLKQYLKDYNISGDDMKAGQFVKSKSLRTSRNLFVSSLYKNKPLISFEGRKQGDSEYADTWNNLLKFDYEELDEDRLSYKKICNVVDFGIYLAVDEGWDKVTETPKKRLISPLCWIPDPYFDVVKGFSFHGFELTLTEQDLNDLYQNKELMLTDKEMKKLKDMVGSKKYNTALDTWADGLGVGVKWDITASPLKTYSIYRHFTKFNNRWYLTEWANDRTLLIRCEEVEAVRAEEKADPTKIPCPVVHSWFLPKEGDPYGLCVGDIARDNQFTEEEVMNLLFNKINEEVFSGVTLFDPAYINGNELAKKKIGKRKYIPAKLPMNTKIIENISTTTAGNTDGYNLKNLIDQKSTKEIGFDEQSIGVYAKTITATQSQLLQANQNVRLSTIFKIFLWGEKNYWDVLWYRSYQKNFKMSSEKNITLNSGIGVVTYTIKGEDLNTKKDLHLRLSSVLETAEKEEADKAAFMAAYQPLMQSASEYGKILLTKMFGRVVGMNKEVINSIYDNPPEYEQALMDLELLNSMQDVGEIANMQENHNIYIQVYQQAIDSEFKEKAIAARKRALVLSGQAQFQQANMMMQQGGNDASTNQLVSNYISQENQANNQPQALGPTANDNVNNLQG